MINTLGEMKMLSPAKRHKLDQALTQATSYAEWLSAAEALDIADGLMAWRDSDALEFIDEPLLRQHIRALRKLREANNLEKLPDLLQEVLFRHAGELNNPELYLYARSGTKRVITEYLDEIERVMRTLSEQTIPNMPESHKLQLLLQAQRIYGRSALVLSGGASFGIYHFGVVKALWEQGLLPKVLVGSSMGSIVAAAVCNRTDAELDDLFKSLDHIHIDALQWRKIFDMKQQGSFMNEEQLLVNIIANVGSATFDEAYARSGRILDITVSPTRIHQKPRILTHLTSPNALIEYAALASCAVPLLYPPVSLKARGADGRQVPYMRTEKWVDGALHSDIPRERLARLHNINQLIVSQANPHVIPFTTHKNKRGMIAFGKQVLSTIIHTGSREVLDLSRHFFDRTPLRSVINQAYAIASQTYLGDINIQFPFSFSAYRKVIANPTRQDLMDYVHMGEQATWPQMAMIRDTTRIGRLFDECIEIVKKRVEEVETKA